MKHEQMQSLIAALVRKVDDGSGGVGPDAAIHAIVNGLEEYVSEYAADLVDQQHQTGTAVVESVGPWPDKRRRETEIGPRMLEDEIRLWNHMYSVLDKAGLMLRQVPPRPKKRGRAKQKSTAKGGRMGAKKAMRRALKGT